MPRILDGCQLLPERFLIFILFKRLATLWAPLLVFMFDRIGRIADETPFVVEWFVKNGIRVWSAKEGEQRFESHTDKLTNYIRFWQADGESEKTSIRALGTAAFCHILIKNEANNGGFILIDNQIIEVVPSFIDSSLTHQLIAKGTGATRIIAAFHDLALRCAAVFDNERQRQTQERRH